MLRVSLLLISLIGVITIFSQSSCFLMGRSGIPSLLTIPESLNSIQNVSYERILNDRMHVAKLETKSDEKMTMKHAKEIPRKKRFETTLKNSEGFLTTKHNASFMKHNSNIASSHLRNVVLILVDTTKQRREEFWNNFERTYSFPVHGYFQVDDQEDNGPMKIELNEFLFPGKKEDECECKQTLRSRISELLTWAHGVKEMTTSVLSAINFSIPSLSDVEGNVDIVKESESNKNSTKERIRKRDLQQNDSLHSMDSHDKGNSSDLQRNYQKEDISSYGDIWDVFDLFTKIRIAFFRAMIDCLNGPPTNGTDDELSFQESSHLQTSYVDLVDGTIKNLKIISGDKGYMLVLVIPENELISLIDLLHHEISPSDTLVIVTELCSKDIKRVSFFADGPKASTLYRIRMIEELPNIIKSLVSHSCQDQDCSNPDKHFYDIPIRNIRDTNGSQISENVNNSFETKLENISNRFLNDTLAGRIDVSSASNTILNEHNMFLGTLTSLIALITLDSS
ncbi:hypothetical protein HZH66_007292 [Vespula vulgaris]|uniref:Uncharacterized protein n=1 Tax=Vespula vulgaris TaxID=7454 RepID=A0A834JYD9_VESVU|nr:uncharacterized protein LOC127065096 [Vespula vulgaris]KAF7396430.1 hypothetical protein HZH66_007292 [Vespula vulgaris]